MHFYAFSFGYGIQLYLNILLNPSSILIFFAAFKINPDKFYGRSLRMIGVNDA